MFLASSNYLKLCIYYLKLCIITLLFQNIFNVEYFFIASSLSMEEAYATLKEKFDQAESMIADLKVKVDVVKSVCLFVIFHLSLK